LVYEFFLRYGRERLLRNRRTVVLGRLSEKVMVGLCHVRLCIVTLKHPVI